MTKRYVALLRAVNVGGNGTLEMAALRRLAEGCGFTEVGTYIASGNLLFGSDQDEAKVKAALAGALERHVGKPVGVLIRTAADLAAVLEANPFQDRAASRTAAIFLDVPPPQDLMAGVSGQADEEIAPGAREIYVHYPQGMGRSKLKIAAARAGTARNLNTVAKLAELARR